MRRGKGRGKVRGKGRRKGRGKGEENKEQNECDLNVRGMNRRDEDEEQEVMEDGRG